MDRSVILPPHNRAARRPRWGALVLVIVFHLLVLAGLVRAFAPDLAGAALDKAAAVLMVTIAAPREPPAPQPSAQPLPDTGAAGATGKTAVPRNDAAPKVLLPLNPAPPAPTAAAAGADLQSGARDAGAGSGGAATGQATGSGAAGQGRGNGWRKLEKIAGDINAAKDFPKKSRDLRIGQSVTVLLSIGPDGLVKDCEITVPSPDPEADRITCALASARFRFRPATDAHGDAVAGKYAWRQRWYY